MNVYSVRGQNQYVISANNVKGVFAESIVFFNSGKEIFRTRQGWLTEPNSSNNTKPAFMESINFKLKRKEDFNSKESFYIKDTLYINTDDLPDFKDLGVAEVVISEGKAVQSFRVFEVQGLKFESFIDSDVTEKGAVYNEIRGILEKNRYGSVDSLIANIDNLNALVSKYKAL